MSRNVVGLLLTPVMLQVRTSSSTGNGLLAKDSVKKKARIPKSG